MAEYLIQDTTLSGIAEAIRGKTGSTDSIQVSDMAAQIAGIAGGGGSGGGSLSSGLYFEAFNPIRTGAANPGTHIVFNGTLYWVANYSYGQGDGYPYLYKFNDETKTYTRLGQFSNFSKDFMYFWKYVECGGKLYALPLRGGCCFSWNSDIETSFATATKYTGTRPWGSSNMPIERWCVNNDRIYVMHPSSYVLYEWKPITDTYEVVLDVSSTRPATLIALVSHGGALYLFGLNSDRSAFETWRIADGACEKVNTCVREETTVVAFSDIVGSDVYFRVGTDWYDLYKYSFTTNAYKRCGTLFRQVSKYDSNSSTHLLKYGDKLLFEWYQEKQYGLTHIMHEVP